MPIYEYRCTQCDTRFTQAEPIAEHGHRVPECPKCRSRDVEPLLSATMAQPNLLLVKYCERMNYRYDF